MTRNSYVSTSESISEGHHKKVCGRIADAVLDTFLAKEPAARAAAGLAAKCTIQPGYAIGVAGQFSIYADTFDTAQIDEVQIEKILSQCVDSTPRSIRTHLGLNKPIYQRTATYSHFGRAPDTDGGFSWECMNLINALKFTI